MGKQIEVRLPSQEKPHQDASEMTKLLYEIRQKPGKKSPLMRKAMYQLTRANKWFGGLDRLARGLPWRTDDVPETVAPRIQEAYKDVEWYDPPTVFIDGFSYEEQLQRLGDKDRRIPLVYKDGDEPSRWKRFLRKEFDVDLSVFSGDLSLKGLVEKLQRMAYDQSAAKDQTHLLSAISLLFSKSVYNPLTNSVLLYDDLPIAFKLIEKAKIYDEAYMPAVLSVFDGGEVPSALNSNAINPVGIVSSFIASRRALLRMPEEERREAARILEWDFIYETLGIKMITMPIFAVGAWLHKKARESNLKPFRMNRSFFFLPKGSIPEAGPKEPQVAPLVPAVE